MHGSLRPVCDAEIGHVDENSMEKGFHDLAATWALDIIDDFLHVPFPTPSNCVGAVGFYDGYCAAQAEIRPRTNAHFFVGPPAWHDATRALEEGVSVPLEPLDFESERTKSPLCGVISSFTQVLISWL